MSEVEVTYGDWAPDLSIPMPEPVERIVPTLLSHRHETVYPRSAPWRRRRYEKWHDDQGRLVGRWTWEYERVKP